jgi:phenylalanyl-tRNA synthetase beta chain
MYDIGQPLHAFDADKVNGSLTVRPGKEGEKITLLDGREIILTAEDSVIADEEGALVIAGAKGGKRAEISESTTKIIIESANFHPTKVRRTSTKYDIRSDSSKRFENEITPELAIHGMHNVSGLIKEMIPEAKFGPIVDNYPNKAEQTVFDFDPSYLKERLGIEIPQEKAKEILRSMGILVNESGTIWNLTIPYERLDLVMREDIVEEVGRIYGYDKVIGILPPKNNSVSKILPDFFVAEKIKSTLIGLGYSEVSLYSLVEEGHIETAKPLARDKAFARNNLSKGMMACVERNALNADLLGLNTIKVFEIGRIFTEDAEKVHLVLGVSIVKKIKGVKAENIIDEAVKTIEKELGVEIKGKTVTNKMGNVSVLELDLEPIVNSFKTEVSADSIGIEPSSANRYKRFSLFPFIVRDAAVFVPESVADSKVWEVIKGEISNAKAGDLLTRHALFDTFKKDGRVSYAFRMIFQSMEKTLTDEEINNVMEAVYSGLQKEGWEVR